MDFWSSLGGQVRVEWTSAAPTDVLQALEKAGIVAWDIQADGPLVLSFTISNAHRRSLLRLAARRGETVKILAQSGIYFYLRGLLHRPVLVLGIVCMLFLSLWVPGRIFFVQVEGNSAVHTQQILEEAADCGIRFGASRREVRSEKVKNALLEQNPQLQWAGVNTYGCVAVITVRERAPETPRESENVVSSIVAVTDGVIRSVTVSRGSLQCSVGQSVKAGQVLISGYTDCGLTIRATAAAGEVFADTLHEITAVFPTETALRVEKQASTKKYSLIIGKNRINFPNSSGISDTGCVRIYEERYVTLPGGFVLPIAIVTEEYISYETASSVHAAPEDVVIPYMKTYLQLQMVAGQILSSSYVVTRTEGVYRVDAIYGCCEMIGISQPEEKVYENH